jgi:alpha-mannosidase
MGADAWDVDIFYNDRMMEVDERVETVVEEEGPLRGVLRLVWRFYGSTITQRVTLYEHTPRIDFRTQVDWQERQVMLKVAFPVNVRSTFATYDIQFGTIARPTHWNTSWDYARFEVAGHKWADLSEGNYGVALLNDCKYGYDVRDNVLRLTLLRSPTSPDATADLGEHIFTYALLPHEGDWRKGHVMEEAYALNVPLRARVIPVAQQGNLPQDYSFATCNVKNVVIETVKRAEEGDGWVVRVYEFQQTRGEAAITFGQTIRRAVECDLMERNEMPIAYKGSQLTFFVTPFEIKTFKVWF